MFAFQAAQSITREEFNILKNDVEEIEECNVQDNSITKQKLSPELRKILFPDIPAIISTTIPISTIYEYQEEPIDKVNFNFILTKGTYDIISVKIYKDNVLLHELPTVQIVYDIPIILQLDVSINESCSIKLVVSDGIMDDITNTINYTFVNPIYYGINIADNKLITTKRNYRYNNITCAGTDCIVYKYPKTYGILTSILDPNGFENIGSFTRTEENINSIVYYVYTSNYAKLDNFSYFFKY